MPAVALSRVVESGPDGENLATGTWPIFTTFVSGGVAGLRKSITGHTTQPCGVPEVCVPCELQR